MALHLIENSGVAGDIEVTRLAADDSGRLEARLAEPVGS
jgi:hypothetical protein